LRRGLWRAAFYKHRAPNGAENVCHPISPAFDDNRLRLMYKVKAKSVVNL